MTVIAAITSQIPNWRAMRRRRGEIHRARASSTRVLILLKTVLHQRAKLVAI